MTDCKNKGDATRFLEQYEWNVESATAAFVNNTTTTSNAQASTMRHRVQPASRPQQNNRAVCNKNANTLYPAPICDPSLIVACFTWKWFEDLRSPHKDRRELELISWEICLDTHSTLQGSSFSFLSKSSTISSQLDNFFPALEYLGSFETLSLILERSLRPATAMCILSLLMGATRML